ncbi:Predicted protein [Taphrina deformans PYCC 5710]|uniref:Telomere length regulation protein conserved domain-containing protein n=1 Tax=Taphrina deformans (strain PYCC 5710 / ATCC 11124 / CBS 356.35 / IMI 108563 / JCM 9778 / NBRC 8474) TaxID=1097556 RepID=R4XE42_TAPDE|nr:Predicted protein [Taphrina deformans PYCC 5710]|eukprot:CCG82705.1 Predicted protein [Taphrina deformans PYCC 5710]
MSHITEQLRAKPTYDELAQSLESWTRSPVFSKTAAKDGLVARIIVHEIIPNFWFLTLEDKRLESLILKSLASLSGIHALLAQRADPLYATVLQKVISSSEFSPLSVHAALFGTASVVPEHIKVVTAQQLWANYLSLIVGGKLVSQIAEARLTCKAYQDLEEIWLDDRKRYVQHLIKNVHDIINAVNDLEHDSQLAEHFGDFLSRVITLGSSFEVIPSLLNEVKISHTKIARLRILFQNCSVPSQSSTYPAIIHFLETKYLSGINDRGSLQNLHAPVDRIGALATYIQKLCGTTTMRHFAKLLLLESSRFTISSRRAVILAYDKNFLSSLAEQCLERWADRMYIKHAAVTDQEALTETILVVCAYLSAVDLLVISKSKSLVSGISNHLEATAERIRFLGMILGETISAQVITDPKKRLTFGVPDTKTEEASWWRSLIEIEDVLADLSQLTAGLVEAPADPKMLSTTIQHVSSLKISEVVEESDDSSDDEFETMRVPDSDDEDSDEDPTLVDRERLRPPVYVRDLIKMINNHDSYKHVSLALRTAPSLIRRKATYGTELKDYAINLAQIFAGLRDNFEMDDFQEMRQEALKALVVASPTIVCPYLSQVLFTGDYSLQQRVIILTSIGLGARELAGLSDVPAHLQNLAVSKQLPPSVLARYQTIEGASEALQESILQPLAIEAAESLSGPAALKVNKTTRKMVRPKQKAVDNRLTSIAADYILFPLLGRFAMHSGKMIDKDADTFYEAHLLQYYLRTASLVYQASTKSPALSRLTFEFWSLLLSLRSQTEHGVLAATLHGLLIIVDSNEARELASEFSRQLVETQEWCTQIFERVRDEKVQMISAGILIRIRDVVEAHQLLMMQSATMVGNIGRGRFGLAGLE